MPHLPSGIASVVTPTSLLLVGFSGLPSPPHFKKKKPGTTQHFYYLGTPQASEVGGPAPQGSLSPGLEEQGGPVFLAEGGWCGAEGRLLSPFLVFQAPEKMPHCLLPRETHGTLDSRRRIGMGCGWVHAEPPTKQGFSPPSPSQGGSLHVPISQVGRLSLTLAALGLADPSLWSAIPRGVLPWYHRAPHKMQGRLWIRAPASPYPRH